MASYTFIDPDTYFPTVDASFDLYLLASSRTVRSSKDLGTIAGAMQGHYTDCCNHSTEDAIRIVCSNLYTAEDRAHTEFISLAHLLALRRKLYDSSQCVIIAVAKSNAFLRKSRICKGGTPTALAGVVRSECRGPIPSNSVTKPLHACCTQFAEEAYFEKIGLSRPR